MAALNPKTIDFSDTRVALTTPETRRDFAENPGEIAPIPESTAPITGRKGKNSLSIPEVRLEYLRTLAQTGRIVAACAAAAVSESHASDFRQKYPEFQELCDEALARYRSALVAEAQRRAIQGRAEPVYHQGVMVGVVYKPSDRLLELLLKKEIGEFRDAAATSRTSIAVSATATAQAAVAAPQTAVGLPPGVDPARMTRAQREAYRAFLATLGTSEPIDVEPVGELAPPHPHAEPDHEP